MCIAMVQSTAKTLPRSTESRYVKQEGPPNLSIFHCILPTLAISYSSCVLTDNCRFSFISLSDRIIFQ